MSLFGAAYAAPNTGTTILYRFRSPKSLLNPPVNGKIQGLFKDFFKAFECFSSTFQGKFYFQGLLKTVLYIQVLFKPVRTLIQQNQVFLWLDPYQIKSKQKNIQIFKYQYYGGEKSNELLHCIRCSHLYHNSIRVLGLGIGFYSCDQT